MNEQGIGIDNAKFRKCELKERWYVGWYNDIYRVNKCVVWYCGA